MQPPESPIASKTRSRRACGSPRACFRRIGSPKKNIATTWATKNNLDDNNENDKDTLFSPKYKRDSHNIGDAEEIFLNFDDDMACYHHLRLLTEYRRKTYTGPKKLPKISDPSKYTLVLDLDETLVHCSTEPQLYSDVEFTLQFNGVSFNVAARYRPHLKKFLETVSEHYELVIFTASQKVYADRVIDNFDDQKLITHRLYREDCTNVCGNFIKDLSVLGRDLSKTIFIDNSPQAFAYQVENSIPIVSWYSEESDNELDKLIRILEEIRTYDDVREYITEAFRIQELLDGLPETLHA